MICSQVLRRGVLASCILASGLLLLITLLWGVASPIPAKASPLQQTTNNTCASLTNSPIPDVECNALYALYVGTDGAHWVTNTGWFTDVLSVNPCTWYGITCGTILGVEHVKWIRLGSNGLSGAIPSQLGQFSELEVLELGGNNLRQGIPEALANLPKLRYLILNNVAGAPIGGALPASWAISSPFPSLVVLDLAGNNFSGTVPGWMWRPPITFLRLDNNSFRGELPANLVELNSSYTRLDLQGNPWSGPIPDLTGMVSMTILGLGNHSSIPKMDATYVPSMLTSMPSLTHLTLLNTNLTAIPDAVYKLNKLSSLSLVDNEISGAIPVTLTQLVSLTILNLRGNELAPPVDAEVANIGRWAQENGIFDLDIANNRLRVGHPDGVIPDRVIHFFDTFSRRDPNWQASQRPLFEFAITAPANVTVTDRLYFQNGISLSTPLTDQELRVGQDLVVLAPMLTATRPGSYQSLPRHRIYLSSLKNGKPQTLKFGRQTVEITPDQPLVLIDLLVSVAWDEYTQSDIANNVTPKFLADLSGAIEKASDVLFDVTDGQFAIGRVIIQDGGRNWIDADIQMLESNNIPATAQVSGTLSLDEAIVLGREWRAPPNSAPWSPENPDGYRTIVHELLHYFAGLYDAYAERKDEHDWNRNGDREEVIVLPLCETIMGYQYDDLYKYTNLWFPNMPASPFNLCRETEQWRVYKQTEWETLAQAFADPQGKWEFRLPISQPITGPTSAAVKPIVILQTPVPSDVPAALIETVTLHVTDDGKAPINPVEAYLKGDKGDGEVKLAFFGTADQNGDIELVKVLPNDFVRFFSVEGNKSANVTIPDNPSGVIEVPLQEASWKPEIEMAVLPAGDSLVITVTAGAPTDSLEAQVFLREAGGPYKDTAILTKLSGAEYGASFSFRDGRLLKAGYVLVTGQLNGVPVETISNFRISGAPGAIKGQHEFPSLDGNFQLTINGRLPSRTIFVVMPLRNLHSAASGASVQAAQARALDIGPLLPVGARLVGTPYRVSTSVGKLEFGDSATATLKIFYGEANLANASSDTLRIYHWDEVAQTWDELDSVAVGPGVSYGPYVTAEVTRTGIYAILSQHRVYLPLVTR